MRILSFFAISLSIITLFSCSDSEPQVDQIGIGGECTVNNDCNQELDTLACLSEFKGGYCGKADCSSNLDCPVGSVCVAHEGSNYCFRSCAEKVECNENRSLENEANCSGSFTLANISDSTTLKACIPPSSSTIKK